MKITGLILFQFLICASAFAGLDDYPTCAILKTNQTKKVDPRCNRKHYEEYLKLMGGDKVVIQPDCEEAKEYPDLVNACRDVALKKINEDAKQYGITFNNSQIRVCNVDASFWSYSDTVYFCAETEFLYTKVFVKKSLFGKCQ